MEINTAGETSPLMAKRATNTTVKEQEHPADDSQLYPSRATMIRHILITSAGAMWWYTYAAVKIYSMERYECFGWSWPPLLLKEVAPAVFVWTSQVTCVWFVWRLGHANTLREAQFWNLITDLTCVPADEIVVLLDPTGNKLLTVLGSFAFATTFFGTMMVHHLREAAFREDRLQGKIVLDEGNNHDDDSHHHAQLHGTAKKSIFSTTMMEYRPQRNFGSIYLAIRLSKAFVSFVVVLDATIQAFDTKDDDTTVQQTSTTKKKAICGFMLPPWCRFSHAYQHHGSYFSYYPLARH